ncbi:hypothetical protein [Xylella fastidiosa]|uniref:hypothetical protein n=1 Tax=Xylella fastidiosa TaxID=2371 RepID=UPI00137576B9|nr:hypothetical protein [Xylella fastidiosa]MBE0272778.1 hypothetical protein [Xylella fastidiosa subsp. fastidiosa]QPC10375.1 hypothetical protein IUD20_08655 [Xylella fastidiosa subsp. fastidiosa]WCF15549.1 hypothetical protein OK115_03040 [Xylella fastidiosa subsp. fastidiosa]
MALAVPGRGQRPHGAGGQDLLVRGGCRADSLQQQPSRALAQVEGATTRSRAANWQGVSGVLADDRLRWLPDAAPAGRTPAVCVAAPAHGPGYGAGATAHRHDGLPHTGDHRAALAGGRSGRGAHRAAQRPRQEQAGAHVFNQRFDFGRADRSPNWHRARPRSRHSVVRQHPRASKASSGRWGRRGLLSPMRRGACAEQAVATNRQH